jgi:hypothetical protein
MAVMAPELPAVAYNIDRMMFEGILAMKAMTRTWPFRNNAVPPDPGVIQPTGITDATPRLQAEKIRQMLQSIQLPDDEAATDDGQTPPTEIEQ